MGKLSGTEAMLTSDLVHNRNCHAYLLQLKLVITPQCADLRASLFSPLEQVSEQYDSKFAYGDLYTYFLSTLETHLDHLYSSANIKQRVALDKLILAIYHNDNDILGLKHTAWINGINQNTRPTQKNTSGVITGKLTDNERQVNTVTPIDMSRIIHLTHSLFSPNFKPQLDTNVPSLKNYTYKADEAPTEYRFSTQAQLHQGSTRISPLFIRWLAIKADQAPVDKTICHIYFNNLGLDRNNFDIAGIKERALSLALHGLNTCKNLKVAVITLPASQGLMNAEHYHVTEDKLDYSTVFDEFYQIAMGNQHSGGTFDFYLSIEIRKKIFGDNQADFLHQLLLDSFAAHGVTPSDCLSTAKKQAIWLHFNKFELTNFIIKTLQPDSFNFSCKDAIDRGTVSSLYYNLFKSFQTKNPMQKDEFERALDAPAATVKGRGMNFQRKILWNALDSYVNAHYEELVVDKDRAWLIFWRDMNCPHSRVHGLLELRIKQCYKEISALSPEQTELKDIGLKLITNVDRQHKERISGQRLMLELVARTSQILTQKSHTPLDVNSYKQLTEELPIKHPYLQFIASLAEIFLALLLFIPSIGYSRTFIDRGLASAKASFFASEREQLCGDIECFSTKANVL